MYVCVCVRACVRARARLIFLHISSLNVYDFFYDDKSTVQYCTVYSTVDCTAP